MVNRVRSFACLLICLALPSAALHGQTKNPGPSNSSSTRHGNKPSTPADSALDPGAVTNGIYRNKALALTCKIPPAWVLRTDEINAQSQQKEEEENREEKKDDKK